MGVLSVTEDDDFLERIGDKYEVCILIQSSVQRSLLPPEFANSSTGRWFINKRRRTQAVRLADWVESQYIVNGLEETTCRIAANILVAMTTCCNREKDSSTENYTFKFLNTTTNTGCHLPSMKVCRGDGVVVLEIHFMEKNRP